jgi:DNA-binding response OmpR family regulator
MSLFLERAGHRVRTAGTFADARARIRERRPDLMLCDLEMGKESGREELPKIAREGELPPTLVVSGYADREVADVLKALPAISGVLRKPFDTARLLAVVQDCLEGLRPPGGGGPRA